MSCERLTVRFYCTSFDLLASRAVVWGSLSFLSTSGAFVPMPALLCPTPGLWSLPVFLGKFAEKQLQRFLGMCSKMNHLPGNIANT
jgi:hypothetical protein